MNNKELTRYLELEPLFLVDNTLPKESREYLFEDPSKEIIYWKIPNVKTGGKILGLLKSCCNYCYKHIAN